LTWRGQVENPAFYPADPMALAAEGAVRAGLMG